MFKKIAATAVALLLASSVAHANDYRVDIAFTGFGPGDADSGPAPFDSAVGSFIFSASSPKSDWTALKAFSLTIGNVSYSLEDVGFRNYGYATNVGGILNTEQYLISGTNDFSFTVFPGDQVMFTYSSASAPGYFTIPDQKFTYTELRSAVPEVETYAMLLAGLAMTGAIARRRRTV